MASLNKIHMAFLFMFAIVWNHCFDYIGLKPYLGIFSPLQLYHNMQHIEEVRYRLSDCPTGK